MSKRHFPIGIPPARVSLDVKGLDASEFELDFLVDVGKKAWSEEAPLVHESNNTFGDLTPKAVWDECRALAQRDPSAPGTLMRFWGPHCVPTPDNGGCTNWLRPWSGCWDWSGVTPLTMSSGGEV